MRPKCTRCGQKSWKTPRAPLMIMKSLDFSCYSISLKINSKTSIIVCKTAYRSDILYQPLLDTRQKKSNSSFPSTRMSSNDHQSQQVASTVFCWNSELWESFQNLSFRPRNLLPSGLWEGAERDEQSGSPGPTRWEYEVRKWERKPKCPACWLLPCPTLLYQEGHWGKLDKACTTSIWIKLFVPENCLLFYSPLFPYLFISKDCSMGLLFLQNVPGK